MNSCLTHASTGIDALRAFGTLGTINRARRRTIYDESGNVVRRGTIYSQRGTMYSQNRFSTSQSMASPVQARKRLPSNNATVTTPNGSTIAHPQLASPPIAHMHSHQGPGHVGFSDPRPASIQESEEHEEGSEPTMSALLRRENVTASPTPITPNFLGPRPPFDTSASGSSTARPRKKSEPTTPTIVEPTEQDVQRPMSMPDLKEQMPEGNGEGEGGATIRVQKPTP